jgi:hypothetical protein
MKHDETLTLNPNPLPTYDLPAIPLQFLVIHTVPAHSLTPAPLTLYAMPHCTSTASLSARRSLRRPSTRLTWPRGNLYGQVRQTTECLRQGTKQAVVRDSGCRSPCNNTANLRDFATVWDVIELENPVMVMVVVVVVVEDMWRCFSRCRCNAWPPVTSEREKGGT